MATSGINIVQTSGRILFRAFLQDAAGAIVTSGTAELRVLALQDDGTLKVYDWTTHQFVVTGAGTPDDETTLTHQQRRDSSGADVNTGIWTAVLTTLSAFTAGAVYFAEVTHASAAPTVRVREFQFGGAEGDLYAEIHAAKALAANKQKHDQVARTRVIYDDDGVTPLLPFNITSESDGEIITETPA